MKGSFGQELCASGREADFGGKWTKPCNVQPANHTLAWPHMRGPIKTLTIDGPLHFCEGHIKELIAAGLITDPYLTPEEFQERYDRG